VRRSGDEVIMDPMTDFLTGYVVPAGAGLAGDPGLKASRQSTGGALSVFETSLGAGPPLHVHGREDECFCVLDGELSIRRGAEALDAAAGSLVFLPRGPPAPVLGRRSSRPAAADRRPGRHRRLLRRDQRGRQRRRAGSDR
jgi:mannose-6-phosphate isomerase-like protein (cupin superfamily)